MCSGDGTNQGGGRTRSIVLGSMGFGACEILKLFLRRVQNDKHKISYKKNFTFFLFFFERESGQRAEERKNP